MTSPSPGPATNPLDPIQTLMQIGNGSHIEQLAAGVAAVAEEVQKRKEGTKGKVVVTYTLSKTKGDVIVDIEAKVDRRFPAAEAISGLFYSLQGMLFRRDPRDDMLPPFRSVDRDTGEIREPSPSTIEFRERAE